MEHEIQTTNQETGIANFEKVERVIVDLVTGINATEFKVETPKGMREACEVRTQIRTVRINLGKAGKTAKRQLNDEKKRIDGEVARLTDLALTGEDPLHKLIKDREDVLAEEKRLRDEADKLRKETILSTIQKISSMPSMCDSRTAAGLKESIEYLESYKITDFFEEFTEEAENAQASSLTMLKSMLDSRLARDAEDAERATEAARLAEQKREQDERQAVLDAEKAEAKVSTKFVIEGSEVSFTLEVDSDSIDSTIIDIWEHPSKYSDFKDGSDQSYYGFIKYLDVNYPDGSVFRLADLYKKITDTAMDKADKEDTAEPAPEEAQAAPTSPVQNEKAEWVPLVRRLKKEILGDILELAVDGFLSDAESLERIVATCKANLKAVK